MIRIPHDARLTNRFELRPLAAAIATALLCSIGHADDLPAGLIWVEGEDAMAREVTPHGWYDSVKTESLSGGAWLSHFDPAKVGQASFKLEVASSGEYVFWLRANPLAATLSYRIDDSEAWQAVNFNRPDRGRANIASDNKPDLRFIAWCKVATLQLSEGSHTISFRMHSKAQNHGGIDCFVLTRIPFVPSGITRPSATPSVVSPDAWFPVVMDVDPLSEASVIDMSHLIESPAGGKGFLKRDGDRLRFEDSQQPTKFWGIGSPPQGKTPEEMDQAAAWFRKHGINIVRQHTMIDAVGLLNEQGEFDAQRLERYDRWFAALKRHGIYSTWSVIYPHHGAFLQTHDVDSELFAELDADDGRHDGRRGPIVVNDYINLDRRIQDAAWPYFEKLLNHVNPHTGLAYKNDPALAIVEVQNESNVFFYTLNSLLESNKVPKLSREMRQRFFQFIQAKYATQDATIEAWGSLRNSDNWQAGELSLMGAHHWGSDGPKYEYEGQDRRCGDYIEFLSSLQRSYYQRRIQQLRDVGFQGVTVTTAWKSGGAGASLANLYCDTAGDCIDRHNYFGGGDGGHRIVEGNVVTSTHLSQPGRGLLAVGMFQVEDRPFAVSEWSHLPPSPTKAEAAPLIAFYGMGLQGWDASYHFNMGDLRIGDGWPSQSKYASQTPHYIGQFPALAFAIHHGHIQEGQIVARRSVTRDDVFAGRDTIGQSLSGGGYDAKELTGTLSTPPLSLAAGRVTIDFSKRTSQIGVGWTPLHDEANELVNSSTGELVWKYGERRVEIRSPKTQGVVGFAGGRQVALPDAYVELETPFVSLIFTPLDNLRLRESRRILVTAMARDRQTGSEFNEDWTQLVVEGRPPLLMEPVQASIRFEGARPTRVRPLDLYGVPRELPLDIREDGTFSIDGRSQTYYYEVQR